MDNRANNKADNWADNWPDYQDDKENYLNEINHVFSKEMSQVELSIARLSWVEPG